MKLYEELNIHMVLICKDRISFYKLTRDLKISVWLYVKKERVQFSNTFLSRNLITVKMFLLFLPVSRKSTIFPMCSGNEGNRLEMFTVFLTTK